MEPGEHNQHPLDSWKAIADHLGVTVRTAQRWESERGLPVRRLPGVKGRVIADPGQLDRWKTTITERSRPWSSVPFLRTYGIAATALLLALVMADGARYLARLRLGAPAMFHFASRALIVTDTDGHEVWRHAFDRAIEAGYYAPGTQQNLVWFGDIDGDGRVETLFVYCPADLETAGSVLYCFSDRGAVKWRFVPGHVVANRERSYPQSYATTNMQVIAAKRGSRPRIVLTSRHVVNSPAQVAALDPHGALIGEYWHFGHVDNLAVADLDGDGMEEVIVGGANNGWAAATLVVLDPRNMTGTSFQGQNDPTQIQGYPIGKEKAVLLFPRTCVSRTLDAYNMVRGLQVTNGEVHVRVNERLADFQAVVLYTLDRRLNVVRVEFSDVLRALHAALALDGTLDHRLTGPEMDRAREIRYLRRF
jgi:hypothetical protein